MTGTTSGGAHERHTLRGGRGKFTPSPDTAERDAEACRLRARGLSYDAIAAQLKFTDRSTARHAVERALKATVAEPAAEVRTLELARIDAALQVAWGVMVGDHIVVSNGRVVLHPTTGKPLRDDGPKLQAIDRVVRLSARRSALLGLDAPTKIEAVTMDRIEAEIARLAVELGVNDRHTDEGVER